MSQRNSQSTLIYLLLAIIVIIGVVWGLNSAGILSLPSAAPASQPAAANTATPVAENVAASSLTTTQGVDAAAAGTAAEAAPIAASEPSTTTQASSSATSLGTASQSTASRIRARGKLVVGVRNDQAPFGYLDENQQLVGLDIDLARELAKRWLGDANKVELQPVNAANRIPKLTNGEVDLLIAALGNNFERSSLVDFSQTYLLSGQSLLVRNDTNINTLRGLQGKSIAAVRDTPTLGALQDAASALQLSIVVTSTASLQDAIALLQSGAVDAVAGEQFELSSAMTGVSTLRLVEPPFVREPIAIASPKDDSALRQLVNYTLQDMKRDGVFDEIYRRWLPDEQPYAVELGVEGKALTLVDLPDVQQAQARLDTIVARKKLLVGVVEGTAPFVQQSDTGTPEGFDIDLIGEFAARWFADPNGFELVNGTLDELMTRLAAGELDMLLSGIAPDRKWLDKADFSQPYLGAPVVAQLAAIALPLNDSTLREQVNYVLQTMAVEGSYDKLYERWFGKGSSRYAVDMTPGQPATVLLSPQYKAEAEAAASNVALQSESAIGRVRKRGRQMIAGVRYDLKPFGFLDESGQLAGFDIDIMRAIADLNNLNITFVQVRENDAATMLRAGAVDIAAAATVINRALLADADFSQSYFTDGDALLIRRYTGITTIADMEGRTVGVLQTAQAADRLAALAESNKVQINPVPFNEFSAMIDALRAGQVDAVSGKFSILNQAVQDDPAQLALIEETLSAEPFGFLLPAGDTYFHDLVNFSLQALKKSGAYDEIYAAWFGDSFPYDVPVHPGVWAFTFDSSPITLDPPVRSRLDEILLRGKIIAGVTFDAKPFGYLDDAGKNAGFDIDLVREFAARWLGDSNAVQLIQTIPSNQLEKLSAGEVDLLASALRQTWEREEVIDFSQTYLMDGDGILVRNDGNITDLKQLDGLTVAIIQGSSTFNDIPAIAASAGITVNLTPFTEYPQAVEALKAGQVDALAGDYSALTVFAQENAALQVVGGKLSNDPYAIGVQNYDKRLGDLVNFTLQQMVIDGTFKRVYQKWFGADSTPYALEEWGGRSYLPINLSPMQRIPAGEFIRGYDKGFPDEAPARSITLDAFYIDQYEVSTRQYAECVETDKCRTPSIPRSVNFAAYYGETDFGNYPVIWVTWQDAADYCAFAGKRLPSEAEWEKAARGLEGNLYPWGNTEPSDQANFNYTARDVVAVGQYPADVSAFGVYDMAGNVREWVADWYQWDYYPNSPVENPVGPRSGVTKVLRGGAWNDRAIQLRLSIRKNFLGDSFDSNLGFRCAASSFPPSQPVSP
jgi:ABC-type amino acid transport substrate-binding protein